jgi:multiple sugar transport system ATP-binding protein
MPQHRTGSARRWSYNNPANPFVAASWLAQDELAAGRAARHNAATIGVRPEHIAASRERGDWAGVCAWRSTRPDTFCISMRPLAGSPRAPGELALAAGDKVALTRALTAFIASIRRKALHA